MQPHPKCNTNSQSSVKNPNLGIYTELGHPPQFDQSTGEVQNGQETAHDRLSWARQRTLRAVLKNHDVRKNAKGFLVRHKSHDCNNLILGSMVGINKTEQSAHFSGLVQCGKGAVCPVCARKIGEKRSNEMRQGLEQAKKLGFTISLLTFTIPHTAGDKEKGLPADTIGDLVKKLADARKRFFKQDKAMQKFIARYGLSDGKKNRLHRITSFESTYGRNGWHPHNHIIMFTSESIKNERDWLLARWQRACVGAGLACPNEYGLDIRDGSQAGEYVTKYGKEGEALIKKSDGKKVSWDMADEVCKAAAKKSKKYDSFTPFQMLDIISSPDASEKQRAFFTALYRSYVDTMRGVTVLKWSRGLKKLFDIAEKSDDDLVQEKEEAQQFVLLTKEEWGEVRAKKLESDIKQLACRLSLYQFCEFMHTLCNLPQSVEAYYRAVRLRECQNKP